MNSVIRYFDLYSRYRFDGARAQGYSDNRMARWRQVVLYLSCVIGILGGPFALDALNGNYPTLAQFFGSAARVLWSLLFGFVLLAGIFRLLITPKTAFALQIGAALISGLVAAKAIPAILNAFFPT